MAEDPLQPKGEQLRLALRWLSENTPITRARIEEAGVRFDLSPLEEEFLLREFLPGDRSVETEH